MLGWTTNENVYAVWERSVTVPSSGVILEHLEFNFLKPGVLYIIKQVRCWMVRALLMYNLVNVIKVCVNIAGEFFLLYLTDCCGRPGGIKARDNSCCFFTCDLVNIWNVASLRFKWHLRGRKLWQADSIHVSLDMSTHQRLMCIAWRKCFVALWACKHFQKIWVTYSRQCFYYFTKISPPCNLNVS